MVDVTLEKLSKIPYIDLKNLHGRYISAAIFYDKKWRFWIPVDDDLVETVGWPAEAFYFSKGPQEPYDICFTFLNFIAQRASFPQIKKLVSGIQDDIFNMSATLAKISHLHDSRKVIGHGLSRMIITEVEYLFSLCRSLFDLLQEILSILWGLINIYDSNIKKVNLKKTFSKMILVGDKVTTKEAIIKRFSIPEILGDYYITHAEFFLNLRQFRDSIIHGGSVMAPIFSDDSGLYVNKSLKPFNSLGIWKDDEIDANNLVPLKPALDVMARKTLHACEDLCSVLERIIDFPSSIVPNMNYYMRGYFNESFFTALKEADERIEFQNRSLDKAYAL